MSGDPHGHSAVAVVPAGEGRSLTDMQTAFVIAFTSDPAGIGNATAAAELAGYAKTSARDLGRRLVALPHVQDAIREANQRQISGALATKSIALLSRVIEDEAVSMKVRVDAARTILDRAGYAASPSGPKRLTDKALAEMTADELRQVMVEARKEMDRGLVIVDAAVAVPDEPTPAQPIVAAAVTLNSTPDEIEGFEP